MTAYRNRTEAPTKSGVYWARSNFFLDGEIAPVLVIFEDGYVLELGSGSERPMDWLDWFGPVEECKEG